LAVAEYGTCQVPPKNGSLRITELENGAIKIEGLSSHQKAKFSLSLKGGEVLYGSAEDKGYLLVHHGSERYFLQKIDGLIQRALERESVKPLLQFDNADFARGELKNRPASPAREPSIKEEIAEAWSKVNRILATPEGGQIDKSVTGIDIQHGRPTFNLHITRLKSPDTIELQMISMSYRRDVLVDDRIVVKPDSIVYHLADSSEPFQDQRYALDRLNDWLQHLEVSSSPT
jgi:hypothetical protein